MISIRYVSSSKSPSGYGSAARNFVTALFCAGINVSCDNIQQTAEKTNYGITGAITDLLQGRDIPYKIVVIHLTPDLYPQYMEKGKYHIGHLFFETDKLPKEWIEPCNQMDELWVGSQQQIDMIRNSGVTTLCTIFPQPIDIGLADERIEPFMFSFPKDFTFYSIFQWIDRKNPRGLLRAYWKAFEGNENVSLLLKTYRVNYTDSEYKLIKQDIEKWKEELGLKHYPKVLLTKNLLTEQQVMKVHTMGDVFINPSSGEGWNRCVQEAMLLGKPIISADNGGITDHMTTQHYFAVPSSLQRVTEQSHIPWYTQNMQWRMIDEDALGKQMRYVYDNYDKALEKGKQAQKFVSDNFSYQAVGERMKKRLEEIVL